MSPADRCCLLQGAGLEAALEAEQMREARLVMLSDIWLDKDETLHKLAVVFDGAGGPLMDGHASAGSGHVSAGCLRRRLCGTGG